MNALLAALLLAAAPPAPAQKAKELAAQKAWEELYLAYSSGDGAGVPEAQRRVISGALHKGCQALLEEDSVMAYSLGERAVVYEASAPALKCLARAARKTDQRAAAEAALRKGMELHAKDGGFGLELGKLLLEEQDAAGALAVLELVPKRSREAAEAQRLMQQARTQTTQEGSARTEAARIERKLFGTSAPPAPPDPMPGSESETVPALARNSQVETTRQPRQVNLAYQSGVDEQGRRTRTNGRFQIRYYNNDRDFGQRAEYEGRITDALDEAYHFTRRILGEGRETPLEVVIYTNAEFRATYGTTTARFVAGMYAANSMRINNGTELTQKVKGTIVHEYVHGAVTDFAGGTDQERLIPIWLNEGLAEYVQWRYMDMDGPDKELVHQLNSAIRNGKLPKLRSLNKGRLVSHRDPALAYAVSAIAVSELLKQGGPRLLLTLIKDLGRGISIDAGLVDHYGMTLEDLDRHVENALP
jgi:hypothetical protein